MRSQCPSRSIKYPCWTACSTSRRLPRRQLFLSRSGYGYPRHLRWIAPPRPVRFSEGKWSVESLAGGLSRPERAASGFHKVGSSDSRRPMSDHTMPRNPFCLSRRFERAVEGITSASCERIRGQRSRQRDARISLHQVFVKRSMPVGGFGVRACACTSRAPLRQPQSEALNVIVLKVFRGIDSLVIFGCLLRLRNSSLGYNPAGRFMLAFLEAVRPKVIPPLNVFQRRMLPWPALT